MRLPSVYGNGRLCAALADIKALTSGAILLEGPKGIGKKTAAFDIASAILCTGSDVPCQKCGSCIRMKAHSQPDYHFFSALSDDNKIAKLDAVRELRAQSFIMPSESVANVFVIDNADKLNPQSQNALLKVLEEPACSVFILLCENRQALLQTVRSRCAAYVMQPLTFDELCSPLMSRTGADLAKARDAFNFSGGVMGLALDYLSGTVSETAVLAKRFCDALFGDELALFTICSEASKLPRDDYGAFCTDAMQQLRLQADTGTSAFNIISIYEYLSKQLELMPRNPSVVALSSALSAFCGKFSH